MDSAALRAPCLAIKAHSSQVYCVAIMQSSGTFLFCSPMFNFSESATQGFNAKSCIQQTSNACQ